MCKCSLRCLRRCCFKSLLLVIALLCCSLLPSAPQLAGFLVTGSLETTPDVLTLETWRRLFPMEMKQVLGSTKFARPEMYLPEGVTLTDTEKQQYYEEGYAILRGAIRPGTVEALRNELVDSFGYPGDAFEGNAWMIHDSLLDFFVYSPLGSIASQLMGDNDTHLIRSWHHVRKPGMAPKFVRPHYDGIECEDGYPPARLPKRTKVKFYVALFDKMAAMHFLNQSSFENMLNVSAKKTGDDGVIKAFGEGTLPDFPFQAVGALGMEALELIGRDKLSPILNMGDVIVHSPCLLHRSAPSDRRARNGFLGPAYGSADGHYAGLLVSGNRQCDSGFDPALGLAAAPRIDSVPNKDCFPKVYPLAASRGTLETKVHFRPESAIGKYVHNQKWAWGYVGLELRAKMFGLVFTIIGQPSETMAIDSLRSFVREEL